MLVQDPAIQCSGSATLQEYPDISGVPVLCLLTLIFISLVRSDKYLIFYYRKKCVLKWTKNGNLERNRIICFNAHQKNFPNTDFEVPCIYIYI